MPEPSTTTENTNAPEMPEVPAATEAPSATHVPGVRGESAAGPQVLEVRLPRASVAEALAVAVLYALAVFVGLMALVVLIGVAVLPQQVSRVGPTLTVVALLLAVAAIRVGHRIFIGQRWQWRMWDGKLCWGCGYDLTGNDSGECPECGIPYARELEGTVQQRPVTRRRR